MGSEQPKVTEYSCVFLGIVPPGTLGHRDNHDGGYRVATLYLNHSQARPVQLKYEYANIVEQKE